MQPERLIRMREVKSRTGLARSTVYAAMAAGTFPHPIKIGERAVAWRESEIAQWIANVITRSTAADAVNLAYGSGYGAHSAEK